MMQQPADQSVGQRKDVTKQYLDIARDLDIVLVPKQYMVAGQYNIYCPVMGFDLPTQSFTLIYCNTAARGLTDIYAQLPRACSDRGRVRIYQ